jgi:hypothetical protein
MTDRELMQQALDVLDYEAECGNDDAYHPLRDALRERLAQPNDFNPDWDAMAVMVEEQQRMAKRIDELEAQQKPWVKTYSGGQPNYTVPPNRTPVAWRKNYQNSGYTYFDERWPSVFVPEKSEPLWR